MTTIPLADVPEHAKVALRITRPTRVVSRPRTSTFIYRGRRQGRRALAKLIAVSPEVELFVVATWADADGIHERRWQRNSTRMALPAERFWAVPVTTLRAVA